MRHLCQWEVRESEGTNPCKPDLQMGERDTGSIFVAIPGHERKGGSKRIDEKKSRVQYQFHIKEGAGNKIRRLGQWSQRWYGKRLLDKHTI